MRVLQLGKFYPIKGGVEKVLFDLAKGISQRGIHCDILCAGIGDNSSSRKIQFNNLCTAYVDRSLFMLAATAISPRMVIHLRRLCRKYDIIHVHHPDPMVALALYLSGYKGKVVLHWHSDILKQKKLLTLYKPIQNWLIERSDLILGTTPKYVAQSPFLKDVQPKTSNLPIGIVRQTANEKIVADIRQRYPGKKIILSIGRLVEYKGYRFLIQSAEYLDDDYVILIAGDGPLKKQLEDQIRKSGLKHKVHLLGFISTEEKWAYYEACKVFCLTSMFRTEAFGIVQIEAMSCGKPVVSTNIEGSGVSWVNEHGVSGLNVSVADPKQIAGAINTICNGENYTKYCEQAEKRYHSLFTEDKMIDECIHFYQNLITKSVHTL